MSWLEDMQRALNFIEKNLTNKIDMNDIAKVANVSSSHFQRIFAILTDVSVGEYMRRRRLTLAGNELLQGEEKIIQIAYKYGYETPESFTKAYRKQHGVTPSETRKGIGSLQIYNPLVIHIQLKGAEPMKVRVVEKKEFLITGTKRSYSYENDENTREIPKLWDEVNSNGTADDIFTFNTGEIKGLMGVCVDETKVDGCDMDYWIAVTTSAEHQNDKYETLTVPGGKWAVFEVHGPMPHSMQKVWQQIYAEWMPASGYKQSGKISFELYGEGNPHSEHYYSEIWIPII